MIKRFLIVLILVFFTGITGTVTSETLLVVKKIEFRGLRNIEKHQLMKGVRTKIGKDGIIIDADSLSASLTDNFLVESHRIFREGTTLIVEVDEKYPVFSLLITGSDKSKPCLAGENLDIINSGIFFKTDMPIIVVADYFFRSKRKFLKDLTASLIRLKEKSPVFLNELSEITLNPGGEMKVAMRNRNTYFIINNHPDDFRKLEKTAAFLDAAGLHPESLDIRNDAVLIK